MSPTETRSHRLTELTKLVGRLDNQKKTPEEIIDAVRKRACEMTSSITAENYVQEIIRRHSKN